jgi:hypothetical protein
MGFMKRAPLFRPGVFVLGEIAGLDGAFPTCLLALVPLGAGVRVCGGIVIPGLGVGFALVLALLVYSDLIPLAAGAEAHSNEQSCAREDDFAGCTHDFAPAGAAFWSGLP